MGNFPSAAAWGRRQSSPQQQEKQGHLLIRVCVCQCDAHSNLGGVIENTDPFHQILLVVGLQIKLPHSSVYNYTQGWQKGEKCVISSLLWKMTVEDTRGRRETHWTSSKSWPKNMFLVSQTQRKCVFIGMLASHPHANTHTHIYKYIYRGQGKALVQFPPIEGQKATVGHKRNNNK